MGGKYRVTGKAYPRMRRPRRRGKLVLSAVAAVVALGLAGWGTLQVVDVFTGGDKQASAADRPKTCPSPSASASAPAKVLPKPAAIKVNVYNATSRSGLAKSAADELEKRGFVIGKVDNAPAAYDKKVPGTGLLLGAPTAADGSFPVLGTQLPDAERKTDARRTGEVDLIIGTKFKAFSTPAAAASALSALTKPAPAPSSC
ncbi:MULTISPECIES: LytR C-terminal domain-containing protein [Streptomyces]|uniref:LytR C-terminal domain-containing protein n=1 Tax=Streptomyces salyersiae TaxID=3075530 RepID=A0ABU2RG13_9ACTN|nr:LytR C-terminal domain-containing protein [Streptomyces sp. DSM 41770]MDT0427442.1 LytR C-terminal domain-containing protein [Streptomyces sp. DSM 41770]